MSLVIDLKIHKRLFAKFEIKVIKDVKKSICYLQLDKTIKRVSYNCNTFNGSRWLTCLEKLASRYFNTRSMLKLNTIDYLVAIFPIQLYFISHFKCIS